MWKDKESKRYMFGFILAFAFLTVIRHVSHFIERSHDDPCYFYMISQIGCILIISCWMITVQSRIIQSKIKKLMLCAGDLFIMYHTMQMIKYCLFAENADVCRYMWYGYYIPMTIIPLVAVYILRSLSTPEKADIGGFWKALSIPAVLICICFMTNDLHGLAFYIPNWYENGDKGRILGPIYYLYLAFMAILLVLGIVCAVKMSKNGKNKKRLLYPAIPLLLGTIYLILYTVKKPWVTINGKELFEIAEVFDFMMVGFLETCIQIGLIPSNMGYKKLFALTDISARVENEKGETVFHTQGAENKRARSGEYRTTRIPVTGGVFVYDMDISTLNRLNKELNETTSAFEARNELLRHENEISEERKKSEATIGIYDRIADIVSPQTQQIQKLLSEDGDEEKFCRNLARSAVLNTYIKRRSNMELEAQKNGTLPFRELVTAVAESLEYSKLSGTATYLSFSGEGRCPSDLVINAYRCFENVLEAVLEKVEYMTVRLEKADTVLIRFLLNQKAELPDFSKIGLDDGKIECVTEENDTELRLCFSEGGDGQ